MNQHDPALRRHQRRLVRAKPELTIQQESFFKIARELPPLFDRHWRELALQQDEIPLDPWWDLFFNYASNGVLHITTVRYGAALVGYIFNLVSPHAHYRTTLHCAIDMFWLAPEHRGSLPFVIRWFRANEAYLQKGGVKKVVVAAKDHYLNGRVGALLQWLGYLPFERVYGKMLGA